MTTTQPSFLRSSLASLCGFLGACVLLGCCLLALGALAALGAGGDSVPEGAVLTVDLSDPITDRGLGNASLAGILQEAEQPKALARVVAGIAAAGEDERISGLLLHGWARGRSWAQLAALREAVEEFSASGKPVTAWFADWSEPEIYMASAADERWIQPLGTVSLDGFAAEMMFFGEGLADLGVEMQVIKVGRFKSAVDPFLRDSMSSADREQWQRLLDGLFEQFAQGAAQGLDKTAETLGELADEGHFLSAERAETLGLVSGQLHFTELLDQLRERTGAEEDEPFTQVSLGAWLAAENPFENDDDDEPTVAILYAEGGIVDGESEEAVGGDTLARRIRALAQDDEVSAVVLRVNSPGGSATASEVILQELRRLQEKKPLVVSMGGLAASGGYWISCLADHIVARPETITGSIGVFGLLPSVDGLLDKLGVQVDTVRTAPHADAQSMYRARTEPELENLQTFVDQIYQDFLERVSKGRSLPQERVHEIGQGRVWLGVDALELGLVDSLGGLHEAVIEAASLAKLESYRVRHEMDNRDALERFLESVLEEESDDLVRLAQRRPALDLLARLRSLDALLRTSGIQARLPYDFAIR